MFAGSRTWTKKYPCKQTEWLDRQRQKGADPMEYRQLPHGGETEKFSVLGLGTGGLHQSSDEEIEAVVRTAIQNGINFFDLCAGGSSVYAPFGRAIAGKRGQVFFQLHFGAVYNEKGEYAWTRDLKTIESTFEWELATLGTDYADFGFGLVWMRMESLASWFRRVSACMAGH